MGNRNQKSSHYLFAALLSSTCLFACSQETPPKAQQDPSPAKSSNDTDTKANPSANDTTDIKPLVEKVLTREEQDALSPNDVLKLLKAGNDRFVGGNLTLRDHSAQVRKASLGQFPKAIVLSCVDSRVGVEDVFDRGIGDIFVARNAGNFVTVDVLGGMEFATKVAGAKLVVVMGHEDCGAVKGAIDDVKLGNLTAMLKNIQPAVKTVEKTGMKGTSHDHEFVGKVTKQNVLDGMANVRKKSPILVELEKQGQLKIVGAVYNMDSGKVEFFDES